MVKFMFTIILCLTNNKTLEIQGYNSYLVTCMGFEPMNVTLRG